MFAYIDAGTAAAIAAMATGGLAGAKVAAQSFFYGRKGNKNTAQTDVVDSTEGFDVDGFDDETVETASAQ